MTDAIVTGLFLVSNTTVGLVLGHLLYERTTREGSRTVPINKLEMPCYEAWCDICEEGSNSEYGDSYHHGSEAEAITDVESQDWLVVKDEAGKVSAIICFECMDTMDEGERERRGLAVAS